MSKMSKILNFKFKNIKAVITDVDGDELMVKFIYLILEMSLNHLM